MLLSNQYRDLCYNNDTLKMIRIENRREFIMNYKYLLFDLDHTLMDFDVAEETALSELLMECQVEDIQAYKDYYKPMNKAMWRDLELKKLTKAELVSTRFAKLFEHFGQEVDGSELAKKYQKHLKNQGQTYEGAADLLNALQAAGCDIYAATNGITAIQTGRLDHSDIQSYFKKVFISEQSGSQKPDKAFYDWMARQIPGFDSGSALMIGDSLTADILGGNTAGIDTVWYNPNHLVNKSQAQPTYEVKDYKSLLSLILH